MESKKFDGKKEIGLSPKKLSGDDVLSQLCDLEFLIFRNGAKKRKHDELNEKDNYRDSLKKKWFKPYGEVTEEARANVPPRLEKDDWNCLVDLGTKQDYMVPLQRIYYQIYS